MTDKQERIIEAKKLIEKYINIIGSNCENDAYCESPECNKLTDRVICFVDYKKAKELSIIEVELLISQNETFLEYLSLYESESAHRYCNSRIRNLEKLIAEIKKL